MPTLDETRLPQHAIEEIEAAKGKERAALAKWWESWASVGDAKTAEREAFAAVVDAQMEYATCRAVLQAKTPGRSLPPGACDCGRHHAAVVKTQKEREKAKTAIDRATRTFKAGG